jgi:hypothetical protein
MPVLEIQRRPDPIAVDQVLRSLPAWFGIEDAIVSYVESVSQRDSFLAVVDGKVIGVALVNRHFPESAEECRLLQVHTVGPSFEDHAYAQTRAFYRQAGFLPLQEFDRIDWDGPSLVLVKPLDQDRHNEA